MSWPKLPFPEVFADKTSGNAKTLQSDYLASGRYPIVDQGQRLIGGYTNDEDRLCGVDGPVIVFGDHTKAFKFVDFPFCIGADGTKILKPKIDADIRYLFYAARQIHIPDNGYSRHFKYLKRGAIPLPPLEEQQRIAGILDQADALRRLRTRAVDKLNILGQAIFHKMFGGTHYEKRTLAELGAVSTGSTPSTKVKEFFDGDVPFITPGDLENQNPTGRFLTELGATKSRTVEAGATLVCCIGATIGKMGLSEGHSAFNQQINAVQWGTDVIPEYGYFAVQCIRRQIQHIGRGASTTLPILKKSLFEKLEIPVAPVDAQSQFRERLLAANELLAPYTRSESSLGRLFASLEHRAFRGAL